MNHEKSCGAVVFRDSAGGPEFLTIRSEKYGHWGFPKGHVEKGESEHQTALREIKEETGLSVRLVDGFRKATGYFLSGDAYKEVIFFAAESSGEPVKIQLEEV
jgi:bis(5'-nucleosidyl)-tetraphosphatase